MKKEFVSSKQLKLLPERIRKAEETDASKELNRYMWDLFKEKNFEPLHILVVGAGGSYPAAVFAKYAICDEIRTVNVQAETPQNAIRYITQRDNISGPDEYKFKPKYDLIIGISYSGKTPDMKSVAKLSISRGFPFVLLTGAAKSELEDVYPENQLLKIISYFNPEDTTGKEKGMISMASTLAPMIIFDDGSSCKLILENQDALKKGKKFVSDLDISSIASALKKCPIIHVFYEWDTLATALDIESKFTESGIANVILHEKKNFSHGRYTSLYNQNFALVINLTRYANLYKYEYDKCLSKFLRKISNAKSANYIEIGTRPLMAQQWNIEAMTKIPYLVTAIGEKLGVDISKPLKPFPKEAISLYEYEGEF